MLFYGILIGLFGYLVWSAGKLAMNVEEGEVAVLTSFGATQKLPSGALSVFNSGFHWKWPWQKVCRVSLKEQSLDLAGKTGGLTIMTADGTNLHVDSSLRYQAVRTALETFLFGLDQPHEHITRLFACLLRSGIANIDSAREDVAQTDAESSFAVVRRERRRLNDRIAAFCNSEISGRYGVRFSAVDLTDILPPQDLVDALNAVINSRLESETAVAREEADCKRRILGAERGVEVAQARAEAVEHEIDGIGLFLGELADKKTLSDYVSRRKTEVMTQSKTLYIRSDS